VNTLIEKIKANLILTHSEDDGLLQNFIRVAIAYAESYQKKPDGYYSENAMHPTTEQAVIILSSHFYESRDGSTAGFYADNVQASEQVWNVVNLLLRINKDWQV